MNEKREKTILIILKKIDKLKEKILQKKNE